MQCAMLIVHCFAREWIKNEYEVIDFNYSCLQGAHTLVLLPIVNFNSAIGERRVA